MSRYRKVEARMWSDGRFRSLSQIAPSGQGLWLFLLTGPCTGPIPGLFKAGRAAMAEELGWSQEAFDEAFREVSEKGMAVADFESRLMWLPNSLRYNKPESPNVVRSWRTELDLLPECELKSRAIESMREALGEFGSSYVEALDSILGNTPHKTHRKPSSKPSAKSLPNTTPNQEQEQEQEQDKKSTSLREVTPPPAGVDAPPKKSAAELTRQELWSLGKSLLSEQQMPAAQCGSFVGKLVKDYTDAVVIEVLRAAVVERPADAATWIVAACRQRAGLRPRAGQLTAEQQADASRRKGQRLQAMLEAEMASSAAPQLDADVVEHSA